jgi:hypothetical protein
MPVVSTFRQFASKTLAMSSASVINSAFVIRASSFCFIPRWLFLRTGNFLANSQKLSNARGYYENIHSIQAKPILQLRAGASGFLNTCLLCAVADGARNLPAAGRRLSRRQYSRGAKRPL